MNCNKLKMFSSKLITSFLFVGLLSLIVNAQFPEDPKPCKYEDHECITKIVNYYLKEKSNGDDSINLIDINPLPIKSLVLQQGSESPVNIKMIATNSLLYGVETGKVKKVSGFGKDLTQKHSIVLSFDFIRLVGEYEIDGKILILPITGKGECNISLVQPDITIEFTGAPNVKEDGTYLKINKTILLVDTTRITFQLNNLFNGDKDLGDNMNLFLNENWKDIYTEIRRSLENAFKGFAFKIISKVFTKYPYEKYFIE